MGTEVGPFRLEHRLAEEMGSITAARRIARDAMDAWDYHGSRDDVLLVVSELVTNALRHGSGEPVLRITGGSWHVRVEVGDDAERLPEARMPGPADGWGLHVIGELCTRWGVTPHTGGKVVWCELTAGERAV
ncbi:ATP-binding protein [Nonomuraea sp. ATR24]|uniref:ATP-binding protein n=1 Tax=Nonomuraea sp. ATR24 TaxID=1676744 RepID=UPI0035BF1628